MPEPGLDGREGGAQLDRQGGGRVTEGVGMGYQSFQDVNHPLCRLGLRKRIELGLVSLGFSLAFGCLILALAHRL